MTNENFERLVDAKAAEQNELNILLSKKRKREYEEAPKTISRPQASTCENKRTIKRNDINEKSLIAEIWSQAVTMHGNWTSINTLKKVFTFLTLNSVINLDYDYCSTANISEARWEEYIKYNGFSRVCFDNFKLNTVIEKIKQHAGRKEEENDIYENVNNQLPESLFLSCCTALHPIARVKFIHTCSPYLNSSKIHWIVGARCLKLTYFEFFSATFSRLCLKARLSNCAPAKLKRESLRAPHILALRTPHK